MSQAPSPANRGRPRDPRTRTAILTAARALLDKGGLTAVTIEAMSVDGARAFALGVQWHPEFDAGGDPISRALFSAFGDACRARARTRR